MTEQEYNELPGLRSSVVKAGCTSMKHMRWAATQQDDVASDAMRLGSMIHMAVLEPARFSNDVVVFEGDKRTKAWKEFQAENTCRTIITTNEREQCLCIAESVLSYKPAADLLRDGVAEQTLEWTNDKYGKGRARLDWYSSKGNYWVDLKSTSKPIDDIGAGKIIASMRYDVQFGWYDEGFMQCSGVQPDVWVIFVESKPPYDVAVYPVSKSVISAGRTRGVAIANRYAECCRTQTWPGVQTEVTEIVMPPWWDMDSTVDMSDFSKDLE